MCFKRLALSFLIILLFLTLTDAMGVASMGKTYHGTLNVVVATPNALIAATDSRATISDGTGKIINREDHHQKLFVLPGELLVTIAGYNCADVPKAVSEFTAPAAGIILNYKDELEKNQHSPSHHEALHSLIHLLTFNLTSVSNINLFSHGRLASAQYLFQMIVAGKKNDIFVMTKVTLNLRINKNPETGQIYLTSETIDLTEKEVQSFTYLTAGWDQVAKDILKGVEGTPSKDKLEKIIQDAMRNTSEKNEGVGGPIQQAYLTPEGLLETNIPEFPRPMGPNINYNLFIGGGMSGTQIAVRSKSSFLFVGSSFAKTGVILDRNFFYGCQFKECKIFINDDLFNFGNSNKIVNCRLYVGKQVDKTSPKFKELLMKFVPYKPYFEQ